LFNTAGVVKFGFWLCFIIPEPGTAVASLSRIVRRRSSNTGGYQLKPYAPINDCSTPLV
jgi:hypothetical protein